jgi:hypothetical protein
MKKLKIILPIVMVLLLAFSWVKALGNFTNNLSKYNEYIS